MPLAIFAVRSGLILAASVYLSAAAHAQETTVSSAFNDSIAPLLQKHCIACHGPDMQEGGLRLDTLAGLNKGGKSGSLLLPGKPDQSLLITAVRREDELLQMPPDENFRMKT
jgi:mono/diheme cytochrome c family protein